MNDIVRKDIIDVLAKAVDIINHQNFYELRELSNHVIHNASIFQDKDSITIAVIIYALSKILRESEGYDKSVISKLEDAKHLLEKNDSENYTIAIKALLADISTQDSKIRFYFHEVLERAQINKASKIYEHGISLAQVSEALGISRWELMEYIGKTTISDSFDDISDVIDRVKFTRLIFGVQ